MLVSYPISEAMDFYGELNDIVVRFVNYNNSKHYKDIGVRNSIAKDVAILNNNTLKSRTSVKKRVLERK